MKAKKHVFIISMLLFNLTVFGQQIVSGFPAGNIDNFNIAMPSGFYQGVNAAGQVGDVSNPWNHLLNLRHSTTTNNHQLQIASSYTENDRLFFRKFARATTGVVSPAPVWYEVATRGLNTFTGNQTINGIVAATSFSGSGASLTGVNAVSSTFLSYADGPRNLSDRRPNTFTRSVRYDFVTAATTNSSGNYAGVMTYNTYDGTTISTGDSSYQLAYVNESGINGAGIPGLKLRKGIDTTWGNWYSIITNNATTTTANYVPIFSGTNGIKNSSIYDNGNVGIGTLNPDQKLTVKGKIHSEEVIVDLAVPADYVFQQYYTGKSELKADYVMPTLAEIESFTKKNHHLPNVPSAKEIQQNGLLVGEMSNVLLQKIEELTLYAIAQQKELDRMKTENEKYKSLSERLSAIEKELKK
jgi:hypothetical protein